jgi:hypothetical protein
VGTADEGRDFSFGKILEIKRARWRPPFVACARSPGWRKLQPTGLQGITHVLTARVRRLRLVQRLRKTPSLVSFLVGWHHFTSDYDARRLEFRPDSTGLYWWYRSIGELLPADSCCWMTWEEELAFLRVHLSELSPAVLRQLKRDILAEKKRREAEAAAKANWLGERPTGQSGGRQHGPAREGGDCGLPEGPRAIAGKR